jgi:glycine cleavage system H protein
VLAHNELLVRKPELMNSDAYGDGWMLIVRPTHETWRDGLATGSEVAPAFQAWLASEAYKNRAE